MSIGPPALGNILVQRLDAVLGTSMAAHANLISGARPDAVTPPGEGARPDGTENATRGPRQGVDIVDGGAGGKQNAITDAKTAAALALAARGLITRSDFTPSAPTTLGATARTLLALLAQFPEKAPPVPGREPLWTPAAGEGPEGMPASGRPGPNTAAQGGAQGAGSAASAATGGHSAGASGAAGGNAAAATASQAGNTSASATAARPGQPGAAPAGQGASQAAQAAAIAARTDAPPAAMLAQALRSALQQSGLFYESHLTQMVYGQRTPEQLAAEPQAAMRMPAGHAEAAASATRQAMADALTPRDATSSQSSTGSATVTLSGGPPASPGQALASIHPDATLLVRQQLDVLANQAVAWQGQPWPGAEMEWEVERDRTAGGTEIEEGHWATRIKIDLPRLGLVEARLNIAGDQLVMHLVAPRSAAELGRHGDGLRQRMTAAGLTLSQLSVDVAPPSPFVFEP
ncbi:Flagellar hook-length control protein FliK [Bordetella ansorpii]|uniref:Flagellar hook-length control protein FliK n=1 Tax=Bordetella ansorpii TaxID=288768 RepID=A0A157M1V0_9BORD|nr:flagellar hook-length control protein FliK [Bordetella ansorpii]SAI02706.1 Flagellar hook-length control protein FliK [Bordetella ansorpii]